MQTLVDPFEIQAGLLTRQAGLGPPGGGGPNLDLEVTWDDDTDANLTPVGPREPPGVPGETWQRARGWSSDD